MDSKYYARRLEERLPTAMQGGSGMSALFDALGSELSRMSDGVTLLMRSRWLALARGWTDPAVDPTKKKASELGRIGALFGLQPAQGEDVKQFRHRVLEFVHIHRIGLGTAPAIMRLAALIYRARTAPEITWSGEILTCSFMVDVEPGKQRLVRLELKDNPIKSAEAVFQKVTPETEMVVTNQGLDAAMPDIELKALERAVAVPILTHKETGTSILYVGRIYQGLQLRLTNGKQPLLNGFLRNEAPLEYSKYNNARFYSEDDPEAARFSDLDLQTMDTLLVGHGFKFDECPFFSPTASVKTRFAAFGTELDFPLLEPGESRWRYSTLNRAELASYLADRDDAERLLQYAVEKKESPPVELKFRWKERTPACFRLRIPGDYVPPFMKNMCELEQALNRALDYGRAAGVKAGIDVYMPFEEAPLKITDTLRSHIRSAYRTDHDIQDKAAPPASKMIFKDHADLDDLFGTPGVFDNAYMNYAAFADANKTDD